MSLSKDNIQYPIAHINLRGYSDNLIIYNINNDKDLYLYYYLTEYDCDYDYINFVENVYYFNSYYPLFYGFENIEKIEGENKIRFNITSASFYLYPNIVKYYVIINFIPDEKKRYQKCYQEIISIIIGKKKVNKLNNEFMIILEDNGTHKYFEGEFYIDIEL